MPSVRAKKSKDECDASPSDPTSPVDAAPAAGGAPDCQDLAEASPKRGGARKRMERKGPWLPAEDAVLVALVGRLGPHSWSKIATHIPGRVGKQCRERYYNHLAPEVNKEPWTAEEEARVMKLHAEHGNSWALISRLLSTGRTANDVKNLWNCALKKRTIEAAGGEDASSSAQAPASAEAPAAAPAPRKRRCSKLSQSLPAATASSTSSDDDCCDVTQFCVLPEDMVLPVVAPLAAVVAPSSLVAKADEEDTMSSPFDGSSSSVVVSPPSSTTPSPFVSPIELCDQQGLQQQQQLPQFQAQSQGSTTLFDLMLAPPEPTMYVEPSCPGPMDMAMWWSQDFDASAEASC